uniref:RNA polymerase II elongation factor ELL N-terminal domain-containing protein n=1 Tax=Sipha flava TaxID=143950 RepID=A0A2S2R853_9HEMI
MSALAAGVQYSLSSNQNNGLMPKQRTSKNKTLFFVKLTDSCLKAVEDYLRCCQQVSVLAIPSLNAFHCSSCSFVLDFSRIFFSLWPRPQTQRFPYRPSRFSWPILQAFMPSSLASVVLAHVTITVQNN